MEKQNNKIPYYLILILSFIGLIFLSRKRLIPSRSKITPRIFISHSWIFCRDYDRLIDAFKSVGFEFYNHSISEKKADKSMTESQIENRIWKHLLYSRCLLVFAGRDTSRAWIKKEIFYADKLRKKIIVVKGKGVNFVPRYLENRAHDIVPFEKNAIIKSILAN